MSSFDNYHNIIVFGASGTGKTCFVDQFCFGKSFVYYDPVDGPHRDFVVDGQSRYLSFMDLSTELLEPRPDAHPTDWAAEWLEKAEGIVLLYDITSLESFQNVTNEAYKFLWECRKPTSDCDAEGQETCPHFGCVVVGNKLDLVSTDKKSRAVSKSEAEEWAQTQGIKSLEIDSLSRAGPEQALESLVRHMRKVEQPHVPESSAGELQAKEVTREKSSVRNTLKDIFKKPGSDAK